MDNAPVTNADYMKIIFDAIGQIFFDPRYPIFVDSSVSDDETIAFCKAENTGGEVSYEKDSHRLLLVEKTNWTSYICEPIETVVHMEQYTLFLEIDSQIKLHLTDQNGDDVIIQQDFFDADRLNKIDQIVKKLRESYALYLKEQHGKNHAAFAKSQIFPDYTV